MKLIYKSSDLRTAIQTLKMLTLQNPEICVWLQDADGTPYKDSITLQPTFIYHGFVMEGEEENLSD